MSSEEHVPDPTTFAFKQIGENLEIRYRKFEDICRFSRDITWESKKTISMMLSYFDDHSVLERARKRLNFILTNDKCFKGLALALCNQDRHLFVRAYSPGVQEFIEALALYMFFKERKLLSYEELLEKLTFQVAVSPEEKENRGPGPEETSDSSEEQKTEKKKTIKFAMLVPKTDFFLGLSDVTGELMRACASGVQTPLFKTFLFDSCGLVRILYQSLSCICPFPKGMACKISTMRSNLNKMEMACYNSVMNRYLCPMNFRTTKNLPQGDFAEQEDSGYE